jgi:hypothetical protein
VVASSGICVGGCEVVLGSVSGGRGKGSRRARISALERMVAERGLCGVVLMGVGRLRLGLADDEDEDADEEDVAVEELLMRLERGMMDGRSGVEAESLSAAGLRLYSVTVG